jgi:DNA-binding NarL/FixJ family response regulator
MEETDMGLNGSDRDPGWDVVAAPGEPKAPVRTLVADHDPISRWVVGGVLRDAEQIEVVASIDSHRPVEEWPLRDVEVVVLVVGQRDSLFGAVRTMATRPVRVLLVGMDLTRHDLDAAITAGVDGCLVKDTELRGLAGGVLAVMGGNMVFAPQLLSLYLPDPVPTGQQDSRAADLVGKLSERELEVLVLLGNGMSTSDVAAQCRVSNATIKSHVSHALSKLGARNRLEAVLMINGAMTAHPAPRILRQAGG